MREKFLKKANESLPKLIETQIDKYDFVEIKEDAKAFFGAIAEKTKKPEEELKTGDKFILDFGTHYVGKFSFTLSKVDIYIDAPVKLKIRFAELPMELSRDFSDYKGVLSESWLQEEIINIDHIGRYELQRRYAFRYAEITVVATPRKIKLSDFCITHTTSADYTKIKKVEIKDELLKNIDAISVKTLEDCMQKVYEDGPKRDRRLWSGDLYLQALTDYEVFNNASLVKRCLYLFAACFEKNKYLPGCLFYEPELYHDDDVALMDYALLYTVTLCDYVKKTNDIETAKELFPIAKYQIDYTVEQLDKTGIVTLPEGWSSFIDWVDGLKTKTSVQGVFLYALERNIELAKMLSETETAKEWENVLARCKENAYTYLYDDKRNAFINEYDEYNYSVHSQVWMILSGVVSGENAKMILQNSLSDKDSLKPVTPYMHHYVVLAFIKLGMLQEAKEYIKSYWGSMEQEGADTFFEVFVKENPKVSPYSDNIINSFCHAWSCTPAYFIRKYFSE